MPMPYDKAARLAAKRNKRNRERYPLLELMGELDKEDETAESVIAEFRRYEDKQEQGRRKAAERAQERWEAVRARVDAETFAAMEKRRLIQPACPYRDADFWLQRLRELD